jgi:uncharacterized protein DUF3857
MKKNYLSLIPFLFYLLPLFSQNLALSFLTIPDSLKTHANAVIRYENTDIEILSSSKMIIKKEMVVTVLNEMGNSDGHIYLYYDDHQKIKSVNVKIYNAFGSEIKKIKRNDFKDVSAVSNGTLYSDDKVIYYEHIPISYPYTIKYEYEVSTSNTAFIPNWLPIKHYYASTEKSTFTLSYPEEITLNFKEKNLQGYNIENNSIKNKISYTLTNAKAIAYETLSPIFYYYGPHVKFAANKFNLAGVEGQANNWEEFGKWMNDKLLTGRSELSEATKNEIKRLVNGIDDPVERARLVYDYMQDKTRYISIQIGIGGWKPMLAGEVEKLGYGDCKALTNYTYSLLKVADVNSYYTILYAKERRNIDKDLASIQGNHAILMVPTKKDTIWLECTSQKVPFGYLGSFTDDRDVLIVTSEGGKIVRTKSYKDSENKQVISGEITLEENGSISAKLNISSSGIQYDDNYPIADMDTQERDKYYKKFFDFINNVHLEKIKVESDEKNVLFLENIEFTADNYSVDSGDKILFRLNVINVNDNIPKRIRNRKLPLEIQYGFLDLDDVIINLPKNYQIDAMANTKELESKFGTYKIKIKKINEHQIKYSRELLIKQGMYSVDDYDKYRKFRKKINQLDNSKIVLTQEQAQ